MTTDAFYEAIAAEALDDAILAEARERFATGRPMRGLPKPDTAPAGAWWSVQPRQRAGKHVGVYLMLRWREFARLRARSMGRLD